MLFYIKNISGALNEVVRVLNANGVFYCSTYGENHMKEISEMVKEFDQKINLSEIELYKIFGLENGQKILEEHFEEVSLKIYDDYLEIDDVEVLCDYIYSCHGNQNHILAGRKNEFKEFMQEKWGRINWSSASMQESLFVENPKKISIKNSTILMFWNNGNSMSYYSNTVSFKVINSIGTEK